VNAAMTGVESTEHDIGKADRPDRIVDFFEGDVFAGQRRGEKEGSRRGNDRGEGR
jgi:hypothetical protein